MYYLKYVSQDMTNGQITPKLIEDIVSVAAYKGAVVLITKNHRNQPHACTIEKAEINTSNCTKWILLDSENSCPITLDSNRCWYMLSGKIIFLHSGDIWQVNAAVTIRRLPVCYNHQTCLTTRPGQDPKTSSI